MDSTEIFIIFLINVPTKFKTNILLCMYLLQVLLAGSKDFSLIGTPLVTQGLVDVNATVIEKTLSHIKTHFRKKRRKQYMRINCKY